jgi:hypothetical protein
LIDLEENNRSYLVPTHYTMILMAYLDLDETDDAIEILSRFVSKFGNVEGPLIPIIKQLVNVYIEKKEYKKATIIVNTMQEFYDTGLLIQGPNFEMFQLLKTAWEESDDPDKEFIIEQINDIIHHLSTTTPPNMTPGSIHDDDDDDDKI